MSQYNILVNEDNNSGDIHVTEEETPEPLQFWDISNAMHVLD